MIAWLFVAAWLIASLSAGITAFHWLIKYAEHRAEKGRRAE